MRPDLLRAVRTRGDHILLDLEVTPGAPTDRFPDGTNPWRHRIRIRVRAPPEDGRANAAVCHLVARRLGVPVRAVTIAAGPTSTQKTVSVAGLDAETALARLVEGPT